LDEGAFTNMQACDIQARSDRGQAGGLFPHSSIRDGQEQFLEDARMCMAQRTHLLAHAPPGLGKTAVSLTAALESTLENEELVVFLTARQSQHAIAVETLRAIDKKRKLGVVDLIARDDMCLAGRSAEACDEGCFFFHGRVREAAGILLEHPLHVQEAKRACLKAGACPYKTALEALSSADVIIGDYNQVFDPFSTSLFERAGRREKEMVVIVDEAHNLPGRIMENCSGHLALPDLDSALSAPALKHFTEDIGLLRELFVRTVKHDHPHLGPEELDGPLKRLCGVDTGGLGEEMSEALREVGGHRDLVRFLATWGRFREGSVRFSEHGRLETKLIEPGMISAPLFARVRSALLMSGTLHPPAMFADLLGIEDAICRCYSSPFPPENRLVLASGIVSSRFRLRTSLMFDTVGKQLAAACASIPGNLVAFFPSYDFLARVAQGLPSINKRLVSERRDLRKNGRDALLAELGRSEETLLMATIGGSFSEGIDFKDNVLSAVIIVGFPVSPPSTEAEAMRCKMERNYGPRKAEQYTQTYPAISKVIQAAGRAIRSENDRAAVLLLDDRYLLPSVRSAFPADFYINRLVDMAEQLDAFYVRREKGPAVEASNIPDR
jgi:DNA excision repair protein ERCC-2